MIFVDDILSYFRGLGYLSEYGSLLQLNEQLGGVDYSSSTDGMVVFVRLLAEQRTVDGYDQCDVAVHLSWLCDLDFNGEDMLSRQEYAKSVLKNWLHSLMSGNAVTVSNDARWQFGYDDFAENVAWVAVRVTLTAAAADCVPFTPTKIWEFIPHPEIIRVDEEDWEPLCDGFVFSKNIKEVAFGIILCSFPIDLSKVVVLVDGVEYPGYGVTYPVSTLESLIGETPEELKAYRDWYLYMTDATLGRGEHEMGISIDGNPDNYYCEFEIV